MTFAGEMGGTAAFLMALLLAGGTAGLMVWRQGHKGHASAGIESVVAFGSGVFLLGLGLAVVFAGLGIAAPMARLLALALALVPLLRLDVKQDAQGRLLRR